MAVNMKTKVFWDMMQCSLLEGTNILEESAFSILRVSIMKMEATEDHNLQLVLYFQPK
jgi:hypothetical protein